MRVAIIFSGLLILAIGGGCSQMYYSKLFRTENARTWSAHSFSRDLLDGTIGTNGNAEILVRVVSVWDSNNRERLASNSYSISVLQRARENLTDTLIIDSIAVVFEPSGVRRTLPRYSMIVLDGKFQRSPGIKTKFHNVVIPPDVNTITVQFAGRAVGPTAPEATREFAATLTRFEGAVKKFGRQKID